MVKNDLDQVFIKQKQNVMKRTKTSSQSFKVTLLLFVFLGCFVMAAEAQDFVYTPTNPAFGGSTYNYTWLLNSAEAQNGYTAESEEEEEEETSDLEDFTESLNQKILSNLSSSIVSDIFGDDGLEEGTYMVGSYEIQIAEGSDGFVINILDDDSGASTSITVPYY